jgi:hypothetical protein
LELLKIVKTIFASYYLTCMHLLKVREALTSMISSNPWQGLKDKVASTSDREEFQEVGTDFGHILGMFYNSQSPFII